MSWSDLSLTFDLAVVTLSFKILSGLYLRDRNIGIKDIFECFMMVLNYRAAVY